MQHRESSSPTAARRAVVISPNARMVEELEPLLVSHLPGVARSYLRVYPSPQDLSATLGSGGPHLVFLDAASDRDQALPLLAETVRMGAGTNVLALLSGNDPDLILRCLRAGADDFLLQPFTAEQMEAALAKLARLQPAPEAGTGPEQAKILVVMPAKGAC